jgi:hypothetical protein
LGTFLRAPFTFSTYLTPIVTFVIAIITFHKDRLPADEDAEHIYGSEPTELPETEQLA